MKKLLSIFIFLFLYMGSAQGQTMDWPTPQSESWREVSKGLRIIIIEAGEGAKPVAGQKVRALYAGRLADGTEFDSNLESGKPFKFTVDKGEVIPGWDMAVKELAAGGKAFIEVPYPLGYGKEGMPDVIPGSATLYFYIELVEIK